MWLRLEVLVTRAFLIRVQDVLTLRRMASSNFSLRSAARTILVLLLLCVLICFCLRVFFASAFWFCHCYHFSSSGLQYKRCKGRSRNKGKNRKRRSPPGASPKEKEVHMCFACFACVFLLRCHYWLHVACIAVLVLACVYILVMV